jgi:hypothetical protein
MSQAEVRLKLCTDDFECAAARHRMAELEAC